MGVANATDDAFTSNATNSTANSIPPQKETATERAISLPPDSIPDSKESNPTNSTNGTSLNENGRDIPSIDRFPDSHVPAPNKQSQPPTPPVTTAVKTPPTPATSQASNPAIASAAPLSPPAPVRDVTSRSKKPKDDRFNHASIDCGALILANNKEASGTTSILVKSKDQYMLNRCKNVAGGGPGKEGKGGGANFVVVELCNTIKIDTLVMGNLEYFSSTFKEFGVYVAEQYPPKADGPHGGWKHLGTFHGANQRDFQYFKIKDPLIFTRYVKVEFLSYHGSEYYCPITQLRVHGKTEMDEFRDEEESLAAEVTRQDAAAQEAIRNIALQAVKSIDQVADAVGVVGGAGIMFGGVVGEIGSAAAAAAATAAATTGEPVPPTSTSSAAGTPNSASSPAAAVAPPPEPSMSPLEDPNSYILSADYFRLFMENQDPTLQTLHLSDASSPAAPHGEQSTAVGESTVPATQQGAAGSGGGGSTSQESIFKTISKRLTLLERNATLSYKFIEEQSRAYHSAFVRVEIARADSIRKALGECNRTMTRVVRDLAKDYEAAWGLLLRDLERQRRVSDSRIKEVERNLDKLSERMTRQIFYEFILVILLVLILTRIFTPNPATGGAALESFTPMGSPRGGLRKRFSPYFMRYMHTPHAAAAKSREAGGIAGGAAVSADAVGDTLRRGSGTTRPRIPSSLAGTVEEFEEEEEEEGEYVPDAGTESGSEEESSEGEEEEEEEGSDVDYFSVGESNRVGDEDTPALTAGEGGVEVVEVVGTPDVPMPSASGMGKGKQLESPQGHVHGPKSASKQRQNGTGTRGGSTDHSQTYGQLSQRNNKSRVKIMVNASGGGSGPSSAHSEPSTPSMNSAARFEASGAETVSGLLSPTGLNSAASKKKRKRRRSLAGLRLQSQSEVVDGNSNGVVPK
ncbi:UNC-like C-terminal-domain-containing protein [Chytriomyces sp. MP71]|nr:UNC-like C-terminal-domain-containing protein [Chytriomyces sp. MP71]